MSDTVPSLSDDELREFVVGVLQGRIYTDRHIDQSNDDPGVIARVFMTVGLGALSECSKEYVRSIGCFYEYLDAAGPLAVNGEPTFLSFRMLNLDDAKRAFDAIEREVERMKVLDV